MSGSDGSRQRNGGDAGDPPHVRRRAGKRPLPYRPLAYAGRRDLGAAYRQRATTSRRVLADTTVSSRETGHPQGWKQGTVLNQADPPGGAS